MIKLKFKNRDEELKFFVNLKRIEYIFDVKIRYAECISDLDLAEREKEDD